MTVLYMKTVEHAEYGRHCSRHSISHIAKGKTLIFWKGWDEIVVCFSICKVVWKSNF